MRDPLDVCAGCSDPWCSCDCALCEYVTASDEAMAARTEYEARVEDSEQRLRLIGADRSCLRGRQLRMSYYAKLLKKEE
jgi:hypothetical protein